MHGSSGTIDGSPQATRWSSLAQLRLLGAGVLILSLLAAIAWIKSATWNRVRDIQREFGEVETTAFYLGTRVQGAVWRLNTRLLHFQLGQEPGERDRFENEARALAQRIAETKGLLATPKERALANEVQTAFDTYLVQISPLLEKRTGPVRKDTANTLRQEIMEKSEPLLQAAEQLARCQDTALAEHFAMSGRTLGELRKLMLLSTLLLLVCTAAIGFLAYRAVVAPLRMKLDETQQAVAQHEKLASLGTLGAGVAHEIRNPLTAIKLRLFSFGKELPERYASHEDLAVIHGEIDRLERIVEDFLRFARPSEPKYTEVIAGDVLGKVIDLLKGSLEEKGIVLKLESTEPIKLKVDPEQIQQVLINLVQNAADSIGEDGTVTLRAESGVRNIAGKVEAVVVFAVSDTGKGIPPEAQSRLFDPFYSTKEGGTGLGLPIAARIAEKHGGAIHFQSDRKRGTTFNLVLPSLSNDAHDNPPN